MPDRGVADDGFGEMYAGLVRPAAQRAFDAAVLVPQRNLEMDHTLAVAVEAEMAGLDDAGMHRPHRHLMDLRAGDREEIGLADGRAAARKADRFQPGMALRLDVPLLADFPLEIMRRRASRGERRVGAGNLRGAEADLAAGIVGERAEQPGGAAVPLQPAEKEEPIGAFRDAILGGVAAEDRVAKSADR